jgi:hypothetical protein
LKKSLTENEKIVHQQLRLDGIAKFNAALNFCAAGNYHFEPALRGNGSSIYHASNTLITRCIEINPDPVDPTFLRDIHYRQARNHDGYKTAHKLIVADNFGLKVCFFTQAMKPTVFIVGRSYKNHKKLKELEKQLRLETDFTKSQELQKKYSALFSKCCEEGKNYSGLDFLHYRSFFIDLDLDIQTSLKDVMWCLETLGLLPYVFAINKTSLTGYHIFMKSELIANKYHVKNWPTALSDHKLRQITPEYIQQLKEEFPNRTGIEWYLSAIRGTPSQEIHRLETIPIPLPENTSLFNGRFCGDDDRYQEFYNAYHDIANVLGSDKSAFKPTALAQMPGYRNPKNGFTSYTAFQNNEAPVLTLKDFRDIIKPKITKWYADYKLPFYVPSKNKEELPFRIDNKDEVLDKFRTAKIELPDTSSSPYVIIPIKKLIAPSVVSDPIKPVTASSKDFDFTRKKRKNPKFYESLSPIPRSAEEYCFIHNLTDEVLWGEDITGYSNKMLLAFSRFAKYHIDLRDKKQCKAYFDAIVEPYFKARKSEAVVKGTAILYKRFVSLCNTSYRKMSKGGDTRVKPTTLNPKLEGTYTTSVDLLNDWEEQLKLKLGEDHSSISNKVHKKLRTSICEHVLLDGSVIKENGLLKFEFRVPAAHLNQGISRYKEKIRFYESLGFFICGEKYRPPIKNGGVVIRKGECKINCLIIQDNSCLIKEEKESLLNSVSGAPSQIISEVVMSDRDIIVGSTVLERLPTIDEISTYSFEQKEWFVYDVVPSIIMMEKYSTANMISQYKKMKSVNMVAYGVLNNAVKKMLEEVISDYEYKQMPFKKIEFPLNLSGEKSKTVSDSFTTLNLPSPDSVKDFNKSRRRKFVYNELLNWLPESSPFYSGIVASCEKTSTEDSQEWENTLVEGVFNLYVSGNLILNKEPRESLNKKIKVTNSMPTFDRQNPSRINFDIDTSLTQEEQVKQVMAQRDYWQKLRIDEINKTRNHDPALRLELDQKKDEFSKIIDDLNIIIDEKEDLHHKFLDMIEDHDYEYLFRHPGCLNRDNMLEKYKVLLNKDLLDFYKRPLKLFLDESDYKPIFETYIFRMVYLKNTVPLSYEGEEDFSFVKKCKSKNAYIISLLALL